MRSLRLLPLLLFCLPLSLTAQYKSKLSADAWVDSVFKTLSKDEKIAQLMVIRAHSNLGPDHIAKVTNDIRKYNIGALCFFQGGPVRQANLTNFYQSIARTPIMVTIDGEWGVGMRLDSVIKYPYQLTLGAMNDEQLMYRMGRAVGEQCKRLGIHVNYAPVVDVNNNPANPVIGYRSFGENKEKVAALGVAYTKGMQDAGIMASAKHFPGHGDVDVDSHYDLPLVNKTLRQLDSLELYPFRALIKAGVGSVMVAHLAIPSIDNTPNTATSISKNAINGLLRDSLGYQGLTFTDALEMKGVAKYFPGGTISVAALVAGNDMLCLPASVPETIDAVKKAIKDKKLKWADIDEKVKKVLLSKYELGLNQMSPIALDNLLDDLNAPANAIKYEVATKAITVLRDGMAGLPQADTKTAYIGIGLTKENAFATRLKADVNADNFYFSYKDGAAEANRITEAIRNGGYKTVIVGVHDYSLRPANNYNISAEALRLYKSLKPYQPTLMLFGNVLALSAFCDAERIIACYQDDEMTQQAAADLLSGKIVSMGTLPVSVCDFKFGDGLTHGGIKPARAAGPAKNLQLVDSIALEGITNKAFPGCVVLAAHDGKIVYHKAFGNMEYDKASPVSLESIFDLASVTKISATTIAVMKLWEEGKIDLKKKLGNYLPQVRGTDKANLQLDDILLHQAGLVSFISFYRETIDPATGVPNPAVYSNVKKPGFETRVAENLYLRNDWEDTLMARILKSPLGPKGKYVYSDNDFIFLGKIVEEVSGMKLSDYVQKHFYSKMGMRTTGYEPRKRFNADMIVPTEEEKHFRRQLIRGDVHDEGASLFGGVAGHAGLFSDAYDLAMLYQMLLNGGEFNGRRYLDSATISYFTAYHSDISRRGLGFDKPEKDNATRKEPYPAMKVSPATFGHTGFTGTCVWADPKTKIVYIFLSNRVYPTRENPRLSQLNVRPRIQDAIYSALLP